MPYATGRIVHDADSHVMEPPGWLVPHADPALAERLTERATPKRIQQQVERARARSVKPTAAGRWPSRTRTA